MVQGIKFDNLSIDEALSQLLEFSRQTIPRQVSFLNAHCVNVAHRSDEYQRALQRSDLVLPDGIGVKLGYRWQGGQVKENVNGTDLFPRLLKALEQQPEAQRIYLLGGRPGVAKAVADWVSHHYPRLEVVGARHGYFEDEQEVVETIRRARPHLLLVAMGVPLQELWLQRNLLRLQVPVSLGVGGLFDFFSGRQRRAPLWMRRCNLEWAYRLWREPARMWRRYLVGNLVFLWRMLHTPRNATIG